MKKIVTHLFLVSILGGCILSFYGLMHLSWPAALPWSGSSTLFRFLGIITLISCVVFILSWLTRLSSYSIGALLIIILCIFSGNIWPLTTILWIFFSSFLFGKLILHLFVPSPGSELDNWELPILLGLGTLGTIIGLLAHFPVGYPGVYATLLLLPVIFKYQEIFKILNKIVTCFGATTSFNPLALLRDSIIISIGVIYMLVAFMPELGFDALAMHLFIPAQLFSKHKWSFDAATYVWAITPMLGDWIFSLAYMLSGEVAPRILLVGFIFINCLLVRSICIWAAGRNYGVQWAILIFISTPLTFAVGSTLFIDAVWTAFLISAFFIFFKVLFDNTIEKANIYAGIYMGCLLLGCAAASKAVTLSLLPILLLVLLLRHKAWLNKTLLPKIILFISLFALIGGIPYLTAWLYTGNPVFPFFNAIFKSEFYPFVNFDSAVVFGRGVSWNTLYSAVFESSRYFEGTPGVPGFEWLIFLIPVSIFLLAHKNSKGLLVLFSSVSIILLVFQSVSYLRYAFPAWVMFSAVIGVIFSNSQSNSAPYINRLLGASGGIVVIFNLIFFSSGSFYRDFSLISIFDKSNNGLYIASRHPIRKAVQIVNELNLGLNPVAVFGAPLAAGLYSEALYPNWYNNRFQSEVDLSKTAKDLASMLIGHGVEFIILEANWNGVNCCSDGPIKQKLLEDITTLVSEIGPISVRKIKDKYYFQKELLANPALIGGNEWSVGSGVRYDELNGAMIVNINDYATQSVIVNPGTRYRNAVTARCIEGPNIGRVQVNWSDKNGKFIDANVKTFTCSKDWLEVYMDVIAPKNAKNGIVYTVGHEVKPLEYKKNSFTQ